MSCPTTSELMQWLDGELPEEKKSLVKDHIASCSTCRSLVEAQKRIETLWREDWTDPDESAFDAMRRNLVQLPPWWRRQRTWFAVAAVFSVYLGVRVFYLDNGGKSLSDIAVESQQSAVGEVDQDGFLSDTQIVPVRDELEQVEFESEEEVNWQDDTHDAPAATELEELSSTVSSSAEQEFSGNASAEPEVVSNLIDPPSAVTSGEEGISGGFAADAISSDASEEIIVSQDITLDSHRDTLYQGLAGITAYGSGSAGGGGATESVVAGSVSRSCTDEEDASPDNWEHQTFMACEESAPLAVCFTEPVVTLELDNGESFQLLRSDWEELFVLADSIFTGETISFHIGDDGLVSGVLIPEGTVLSLPEQKYANSTVTISCD